MVSKIDRRAGPRVAARLPVKLRAAESEMTAETRDVSTHGIFLFIQSRLAEGSNLELVLMLPPELTAGRKCWVCCHARVLRVERAAAGNRFGVAAQIQRIDILPEISGV
jgi:hypothetical protein